MAGWVKDLERMILEKEIERTIESDAGATGLEGPVPMSALPPAAC
jgi:hypothetical protein